MPLRVSHKIFLELEKAILSGEYKPHSRFPSERELARIYAVSRPAVREAMAHLSELGLVKTLAQSGTYVTDYQTEGSLDLLIHIMKSNKAIDSEILISLLKIRRMAESFMAYEASLQAGPNDVVELKDAGEALIGTIRTRPDDIRQLSERDFTFHSALSKASRNLVSQLLFNSFKPMYKYYAEYYYSLPDTHPVTIQFVQDLLGAITNKDGDRAETVMREAIIFSEERLIETLGLRDTNKTISLRSGV
jgi:GntR family transcriptional regulator, transcriptional repressor for pyruvate dehydrogenase complex